MSNPLSAITCFSFKSSKVIGQDFCMTGRVQEKHIHLTYLGVTTPSSETTSVIPSWQNAVLNANRNRASYKRSNNFITKAASLLGVSCLQRQSSDGTITCYWWRHAWMYYNMLLVASCMDVL